MPVSQRPLSLGSCRSALQASKHASPAGVRELAPPTGIAQRGRPWVRVGRRRTQRPYDFGVALSIEDDYRNIAVGSNRINALARDERKVAALLPQTQSARSLTSTAPRTVGSAEWRPARCVIVSWAS